MLSLVLPLMLAATPTASEQDARCLAVVAYLAGTVTDPAGKQSAVIGVSYFFGKLKGVDPNFALEANMRRIYRANPNIVATDRERCLRELAAMGNELSTSGNSISANP